MTVTVGYSGTPLAKKLGFRPGQAAAFLNLPPDLEDLATAEAFGSVLRLDAAEGLPGEAALDIAHGFYKEAETMRRALPALRAAIRPAGAIWISWPKKASKVRADISENEIRDAALAGGLVDVKVCAVSEVWSGLKLVIPVALRAGLV